MSVARPRHVFERDGDDDASTRQAQGLVEHGGGGRGVEVLEQMQHGNRVGGAVGQWHVGRIAGERRNGAAQPDAHPVQQLHGLGA